MIHEVPKEKWLYRDRGMVKWLGFFMSDHTNFIDQERANEQALTRLPQQPAETIDSLLQQSWEHTKTVNLQIEVSNHLANHQGIIIGFERPFVFLQTDTGMLTILFNAIRHAELIKREKWWVQDV